MEAIAKNSYGAVKTAEWQYSVAVWAEKKGGNHSCMLPHSCMVPHSFAFMMQVA